MKVSDALKQRKSTRSYLNKPVEDEKIQAILEVARFSPSGTNTQPWQVAVVSGGTKTILQNKIETAFREGDSGKSDYNYYPEKWISPYKERRKECGLLMYSTLDIKREEKERQKDQWAANYRAFDAPILLLFFIDSILDKGSYMDYGMFLQSIMLAAEEQGLSSCPLASLADYPHIIKPELGYKNDTVLLCGIGIGYEDKTALINSYRTSRVPINKFTRFYK